MATASVTVASIGTPAWFVHNNSASNKRAVPIRGRGRSNGDVEIAVVRGRAADSAKVPCDFKRQEVQDPLGTNLDRRCHGCRGLVPPGNGRGALRLCKLDRPDMAPRPSVRRRKLSSYVPPLMWTPSAVTKSSWRFILITFWKMVVVGKTTGRGSPWSSW